jgi:hypothetical protein
LALLRSLSTRPVIWKTSNPKTLGYSCSGGSPSLANAGEAAVEALNAAAAGVLAALPPGTAVALDTHALLLPLFDEGQFRHHHCSDLLKIARGDPRQARTMGRVFSG